MSSAGRRTSARAALGRVRDSISDFRVPNVLRRAVCLHEKYYYDNPGLDTYYIDEPYPYFGALLDEGVVQEAWHINRLEKVKAAERTLAEVDSNIKSISAGAKDALVPLQEQRVEAQKSLAYHRSMLCPVNALPPDLLSLIFTSYCHLALFSGCYSTSSNGSSDEWADVINPSADPIRLSLPRMRAPFIISNVCHHWRTNAFNTPQLWTYIGIPSLRAITWSQMRVKMKNKHLAMVGRWLGVMKTLIERSGDARLDVRMPSFYTTGFGEPEDKHGPNLHRSALQLLAPHAARIRRLEIAPVGQTDCIWHALGSRSRQLSELQYFTVERNAMWVFRHAGAEGTTNDEILPSDQRLHMPKLREVRVSAATHVLHPTTTTTRGWAMTSLTLTDDAQFNAHVWHILAPDETVGFPCVPSSLLAQFDHSDFELGDKDVKPADFHLSGMSQRMPFPKLRVMHVSCTRPMLHLEGFMHAVWTPRLKYAGLRVGYSLGDEDATGGPVSAWLRELHASSVTHISLSNGTLNSNHGAFIAARCDIAEDIRIEGATVHGSFLAALRNPDLAADATVSATPQAIQPMVAFATPLPTTAIPSLLAKTASPSKNSVMATLPCLKTVTLVRSSVVVPLASVIENIVRAAEPASLGPGLPTVGEDPGDTASAVLGIGNISQYVSDATIRYC
ncbi:hypothetical protein BKA62DRAFT_715660 [Auriculariales sp. MPI-PUGE-AT-0066]|nr:hypothetical protein BKA62DRAFT_715660 [Auriculariales sp. MPI-PUGE-AT-0066]